MTRSFYATRLLTLILVFSGLAMLSGCSLVSPGGAQSGSTAQPAEIVMSGDCILNKDGTFREPRITPSVSTVSELTFQFNETGARQAARHSINLISYSWASGNAAVLDELSEERRTYCQSLSNSIASLYEIGGQLHGLKYIVSQIEDSCPVNTNSPEIA